VLGSGRNKESVAGNKRSAPLRLDTGEVFSARGLLPATLSCSGQNPAHPSAQTWSSSGRRNIRISLIGFRLRSRRSVRQTALNSISKKALAVRTLRRNRGKVPRLTLPTQRGTTVATRRMQLLRNGNAPSTRVLCDCSTTNRASNFSLCLGGSGPNSLTGRRRGVARVSAGLSPPIWTFRYPATPRIVHPPYLRSRSTHRKKRWQGFGISPRRSLRQSSAKAHSSTCGLPV